MNQQLTGGRLHPDAGYLRRTEKLERFDRIIEQRPLVQSSPGNDSPLRQAYAPHRIRSRQTVCLTSINQFFRYFRQVENEHPRNPQ